MGSFEEDSKEDRDHFWDRWYAQGEQSFLRVLDLVSLRNGEDPIDDIPILQQEGGGILSQDGEIELENTDEEGNIKRNVTRVAVGAGVVAVGTVCLRVVKKRAWSD